MLINKIYLGTENVLFVGKTSKSNQNHSEWAKSFFLWKSRINHHTKKKLFKKFKLQHTYVTNALIGAFLVQLMSFLQIWNDDRKTNQPKNWPKDQQTNQP